ncbi:hypothetical protein D9756_003545 [Leucocoprinus leucothites]|uniref:DUF2415 domain-containing protein n=1 Tax=Leucocoprinus leucothites TaxID=201217 RepID=A0A8H5G730_9AGAR|nr:hypothetical protein D9756_003545 [Leucoagaricus leucothites]
MANDPPLLASTTPSALVPADVTVSHIQLRDLVICPRERGVLNYVHGEGIIEHDILNDTTRKLADLNFIPNTLAALPLNSNDTLMAAGGQDAELHLSYHTITPSKRSRSKLVWQTEQQLSGSINNSVFLTSLSLTRSNQSAVEPRVGISNNDSTVRLYEVPIRVQSQKRIIRMIGTLRLDVPINHSSISPDGRTLLSVGDSSKIYFHHMRGGEPVTFERIHNLVLPPPDSLPILYPSSLAASFSTAFSSDGMKFAVASQEGVVAVWDVRSTKPMKVIQTDKHRGISSDDGYLSDDPTDWTRGRSKAPGFSVRNVKFGGGGVSGKEVMTFTEHTSLLHVFDARTFEAEQTLKVPTVRRPENRPSDLPTPSSSPRSSERRPPIHRHVFSSITAAPRSPAHLATSPSPQRRSSAPTVHPQIIEALNDAFRIPTPSYSPPSSISDSTWRTLRLSHVRNGREGDDYEEIVVVPSLGDRNLESEVHALLNARPRDVDEDEEGDPNTGSSHGDYSYRPPRSRPVNRSERQEEDMEVDELESDCLSSHASRSTSPIPSETTGRPPPGLGQRRSQTQKVLPAEISYRDDLDIAGTCFDPAGGCIYVASKESVVEWSLRDADKRWWLDQSWR